MWGAIWQITLKLQREIGEMGGAFYPFFWHISETVRAASPHMSRQVKRNENFEKNTLVWRDLTAFVTAFCDFVSSTMDVYEAISTHRRWAEPWWRHTAGGVWVIKYKVTLYSWTLCITFYTMAKVVQNPGWQTLDPVLNAPECIYILSCQICKGLKLQPSYSSRMADFLQKEHMPHQVMIHKE